MVNISAEKTVQNPNQQPQSPESRRERTTCVSGPDRNALTIKTGFRFFRLFPSHSRNRMKIFEGGCRRTEKCWE
jgi:hypothetical protein